MKVTADTVGEGEGCSGKILGFQLGAEGQQRRPRLHHHHHHHHHLKEGGTTEIPPSAEVHNNNNQQQDSEGNTQTQVQQPDGERGERGDTAEGRGRGPACVGANQPKMVVQIED